MTAPAAGPDDAERVRVWLVERSYSDDEQNLIVLVYATPDGERYYRKERALTSFDDDRPVRASVCARPRSLGAVADPEERERYAAAVAETRAAYGADEAL